MAEEREYGKRFNSGKPQLSYLPLDYLTDCANVLQFGAEKYSRNGFRTGFKETSILDSMLRHIAALQRGEIIDPESGLPHIGHIQCNALFLGNPNNEKDITQ